MASRTLEQGRPFPGTCFRSFASRPDLFDSACLGQEEPQTRLWRFGPEEFTKDTRGNATIKYRV